MGDVNSGGELAVVHDVFFVDHARKLASSLGAKACDLNGLQCKSLSNTNVVIDANLQDLAAIAALKSAFGPGPRFSERIFLVDDGLQLRASRVQAAALGASRTLIRGKTTLTEILKCDLVPRPGAATLVQHDGLADRPGGGSIVAASGELARLFDGVVSGQPLDMGQVTAASAQILNGMSKVGEGAWLDLVRAHHEGTFQHCLLVAGVAARYAQFTGLRREYAHLLVNAAMLHDVGKAVVPLSILDKPGRLTDEERAVIERHPGAGFDYLAKQSGLPKAVLDAVLHHHEML
ncbi:MAG: HD domain-containing protein, partial [Alphaproteobacteria bacterium]|nr:HD domain-containing protein [Alphaproteobacteria bacterium]